MTYIAKNFEEFTAACVQIPAARLKVVDEGIAFITEQDSKHEVAKNLGRFIKSGFSTRKLQNADNYEVTQKLAEWRRQAASDSPWKSFGKEDISRPSQQSARVKQIVDGIVPTLGVEAQEVANRCQKLYAYEKRLWALDRGADKSSTWSSVAKKSSDLQEATDDIAEHDGDVFSQDVDNDVFEHFKTASKEMATQVTHGDDTLLEGFELDDSEIAPLAKFVGAENNNVSIASLIMEIGDITFQIDELNSIIKDPKGSGSLEHSLAAFDSLVRRLHEKEAHLKLLSGTKEALLANQKKYLPKENIKALKDEINSAEETLRNGIPSTSIMAMRYAYWNLCGECQPYEDIPLFIDLSEVPLVEEYRAIHGRTAIPETERRHTFDENDPSLANEHGFDLLKKEDAAGFVEKSDFIDGQNALEATVVEGAAEESEPLAVDVVDLTEAKGSDNIAYNLATLKRVERAIQAEYAILSGDGASTKKATAEASKEVLLAAKASLTDLICSQVTRKRISPLNVDQLGQLKRVVLDSGGGLTDVAASVRLINSAINWKDQVARDTAVLAMTGSVQRTPVTTLYIQPATQPIDIPPVQVRVGVPLPKDQMPNLDPIENWKPKTHRETL